MKIKNSIIKYYIYSLFYLDYFFLYGLITTFLYNIEKVIKKNFFFLKGVKKKDKER